MRTIADALGGAERDEDGHLVVGRESAKPCRYCGAEVEVTVGPQTGTRWHRSPINCCPQYRAARAQAGYRRYP